MIVLRFRFEIAIKNRNKKNKIELKLNLSHGKNFEFLVAMKRAHTFQSQLEIADWARITWVHFLDGYRSHTIVETREYCKSRNNVKKTILKSKKNVCLTVQRTYEYDRVTNTCGKSTQSQPNRVFCSLRCRFVSKIFVL